MLLSACTTLMVELVSFVFDRIQAGVKWSPGPWRGSRPRCASSRPCWIGWVFVIASAPPTWEQRCTRFYPNWLENVERRNVKRHTDTSTSAVLPNNESLSPRRATQSKNHFFLHEHVDCDKGIPTMILSLSFPPSPPFLAPFVLSQVNCNHVIQSTPFPPEWKKGNKKQFCASERGKEGTACVFFSVDTLPASQQTDRKVEMLRDRAASRGWTVRLPELRTGDPQGAAAGRFTSTWELITAARPRFDVSVRSCEFVFVMNVGRKEKNRNRTKVQIWNDDA